MIFIFSVCFTHPFYLGVTDLKYNIKEKSLQGSVKLFTSDFEAALKKIHKKSIDLINVKDKEATLKMLATYLNERLKIKVNNKVVGYKLIGFENEEEAVWMYIECNKTELPKKIEIENSLLCDYLKEQMNIVHIEVKESKKSLKVTCPDKNLKFDF